MQKFLALALIAFVSLGILAGCGSTGKTEAMTVIMGENGAMAYSPSTLTVAKGDTVEVTLINKDTTTAHSFVINELNVKSDSVPPKTTQKVTFKAGKVGSFEFYCDVPGHRASGMKGTITVTG